MKHLSKGLKIFGVLMVLMVCMGTTTFAKESSVLQTEQAEKQAQLALENAVVQDMTEANGYTYEVEGGGYVGGETLWQDNDTKKSELPEGASQSYQTVNEQEFNKLSSTGKKKFVTDLSDLVDKYKQANPDTITDTTVDNWYEDLQKLDGIGSQLLGKALQNTYPRWAKAQQIFEPFSGLIGTILALLAICILAFLGLVMVLDLAYIVIPPFRFIAGDQVGPTQKGKGGFQLVSHDAIYAVKQAEETGGSGDGAPPQALAVYFKRRVVALIILGICLLYLIQGQIYVLVAMILDLVSGFLGF